jgi:hypothetical protein
MLWYDVVSCGTLVRCGVEWIGVGWRIAWHAKVDRAMSIVQEL